MLVSVCAFLYVVYGAPEEGELKGQQPLTLRNQLLSKRPEMVKAFPYALKMFLRVWCFLGVYGGHGAQKPSRGPEVAACNSAPQNYTCQ